MPTDLDKIGKREPFKVPEGFFNDLEASILQTTVSKSVRTIKIRPWWTGVAAASTAIILLVISFFLHARNDKYDIEQVDQAFAQLSEADQLYFIDIYEDDIFINN